MTAKHLSFAILLLVGMAFGAAPVGADDVSATGVTAPILKPGGQDLLPFDDFGRQDFNKKNGVLVYRLGALEKKAGKLRSQAYKIKNAKDAKRRGMLEEARRLTVQTTALRMRLTQELVASGIDGSVIAYINGAPRGAGRMERYAHGLVLLLSDLSDKQRALFEQVVTQIDGAYHAITATKERTLLSLKQSKLDKAETGAVRRTFDAQLRLIDQRFWLLVDLTLGLEQKAALWNRLPGRMRRKSQPIEHLYQLPGLTPAQATRLRAVQTEQEHELSPDTAAVKRIAVQLKDKALSREQRQALTKQRGTVYGRIMELRRSTAKATRSILTDEQWLAFEAIPPRVSTNERSGNYRRVLNGFKPDGRQQAQIRKLQAAQRVERRATQKRMAEIRRSGGDYSPDSPQMAGMQMAMAGAKAESAASNRTFLGAVFLDVLRADDVSRWVMGHWGYKR